MSGNLDFWYDDQIRRYLTQLIRVFSHFKVREYTSSGIKYNRVPAKYGDSSRMVASLLRNNSENAINSAPLIAITVQNIQTARDRTQDPFLVDTNQVAEREWDQEAGRYTSEQGNLYTTQRYMPVPYNLTIQADIWTTNTDTKLQILEQILVLFNPSIQLQSNSNPLDWSSVFEVELTDITWTSRSIPAGVDDSLDIATLTFAVPIWISPPAKVKRQTIIQRIVADIHSTYSIADLGYSKDYADFFKPIEDTAEIIVTPNDYYLLVEGSRAQLINNSRVGQPWDKLIEMQGYLTSTSRLKLNITNDSDNDQDAITGFVAANPLDSTSLIFNLDADTLPSNTLASVDRIIDPRASYPGDGGFPEPVLGQRYLITENLSVTGYPGWGLDASENDIIQYTGEQWEVVFSASNSVIPHYVTNTYTGKQYKWTGEHWVSSYEGIYNPGYFRLVL